jgi:hypothetical protein
MTDLAIRLAAIVAIPLTTFILLRAIHRDPSVIGMMKPSAANAGQQSAIPPRIDLEKRLVACNPRVAIPAADKDLNDIVAQCEKTNAPRK